MTRAAAARARPAQREVRRGARGRFLKGGSPVSPGRSAWKPTEKIFSAARDLEKAALPQAIDSVHLARQVSPVVIARLARIVVESADEQRVIEAAETILNRGLGLPTQNVALLHGDLRLDPEQAARASAALERLKGYFKAGQNLLEAREPAPAAETAPTG